MAARIGIVAPYPDLAVLCREVCVELSEPAEIGVGDLAMGVDIAREMQSSGVDVIISRGGTALSIERAVEIPVVSIEVSPLDIIRAVEEARVLANVIGVVGFKNVIYGIDEIAKILGVTLIPMEIESAVEVESKIRSAMADGLDVVVGDSMSTRTTSRLGVRSVLIHSGKDAIARSIAEAKRVAAVSQREKERAQELLAIIDSTHEGIMGIDPDGTIRFLNPLSARMLGLDAKDAAGSRISDIIPEISVGRLAKQEGAEIEEVSKIGRSTVVITQVPVKVNNEITGAVITLQDVTRIQQLEEKVRKELRSKGHIAKYTFDDINAVSKPMKELIERARRYARVDSTILITGETGTGKELFAQSIHNESTRRSFPFVAINCAAMPHTLLESELFGYEEGAFTGARRGGKRGLLEQAHKGTLFLDEIGEMPVQLQSRLLRVLEEREMMRIAGDKVIPVDIRVISATNANVRDATAQGSFRKDLYYRLNILELNIPPLRERKEDIGALAQELLLYYSKKFGMPPKRLAPDALQVLQVYSWPGNVRELKNVIERIAIGVDRDIVRHQDAFSLIHHLSSDSAEKDAANVHEEQGPASGTGDYLHAVEQKAIMKALEETRGNRTRSAELLGISRTTLWRKLKRMEKT